MGLGARMERGPSEAECRARFQIERLLADRDADPGQRIMRLQRAERRLRKELARSRIGSKADSRNQ